MSRAPTNNSLLLQDARIVLSDRVVENSALLIEEGRIARIDAAAAALPAVAARRDLNGLTLYPGMIDVHIHGAVGVDTTAANRDELDRVSQFLAANGVTGWLPTLVPAATSEYQHAVRVIDELMNEQHSVDGDSRGQRGARVLGVHYEGPFVNTAQCGALRAAYFRTFSTAADIDTLPTPGEAGAVRMMTLAPEVVGGVELTRELVRRGWIVSVGHTRAGIDVLDRAFMAGARHMTHFMNAMPPLHHRAPGAVGWGLANSDVTVDVIADGVHLDPLVLQLLLRTKGAERLLLISDAIAAAGKGDGDYAVWGETITVREGRTSNARGSIAGSVITMSDAARVMRSLGASELEVARMTSTNPARLLGIASECGSIAEGKRADLVAVDGQGEVRMTIIGGQVVYEPR